MQCTLATACLLTTDTSAANNNLCDCLPHRLQEHKFWEESFKVYERGLSLFKWPHVRDLWQTYLSHFVQRYKGTKLERARDLFRQAIDSVSLGRPVSYALLCSGR